MARRERSEFNAAAAEEPVGGDEESIGRLAHKRCECRLDVAAGAGLKHRNLQAEGAGRFRRVAVGAFRDSALPLRPKGSVEREIDIGAAGSPAARKEG